MSKSQSKQLHRREVLRGGFGGLALSVSLPIIECLLNDSGTALADGTPIPTRFGTWFWPMGHTPGHAIAERSETGKGIKFLSECESLAPYGDKLNFFGGYMVPLDGRPNFVHKSGWVGIRTGSAPSTYDEVASPTLDILIADEIGTSTRFKSLDMNSIGDPSVTFSMRSSANASAAEINPFGLYSRVFGVEFVDPNLAEFTPDVGLVARKSVLSGVMEQSKSLYASLGAADRVRMDQYFSSIRQLENQLELSLRKPDPNPACKIPPDPRNLEAGAGGSFVAAVATQAGNAVGNNLDVEMHSVDVDQVSATHRALIDILAMALVCDQTRVFNVAFSNLLSRLSRPGESYTHHNLTHEEPIDPDLGYQPISYYLNKRCAEAFAYLLNTFDSIPEGDGTLLDNMIVFANSETSLARTHSIDNIPMFTAGSGGGRLKTGYHVVGSGDPGTRVSLTALRAMGVPIETWGTGSLQTSRAIEEVLA